MLYGSVNDICGVVLIIRGMLDEFEIRLLSGRAGLYGATFAHEGKLCNGELNMKLYDEYKKLAQEEKNIKFCGRFGEYKYYDMDAVVCGALNASKVLNRVR